MQVAQKTSFVETPGVSCAGLLCTITTNRPGKELEKSEEKIK